MIKRGVRSLKQMYQFSGGHHHQELTKPVYAPSVQERMYGNKLFQSIYLNIYNNGLYERIPAYVGESLLQALNRFHMSSVPGHCQGGEALDSMLEDPIQPNTFGPQCTSCHVMIASPWVEKLRDRYYLEDIQLNLANSPSQKHSRLACCIKLDKSLDEMQVSIPLNALEDDD